MKKLISVLFFSFVILFDLASAEHWFSEKFSPVLVNARGRKINAADALNGKKVAVYFSASWCGPCRMFTPVLKKFYQEVASKNNFEIVFVSSDKNKAAMMQYMKKNSMPWLAVPFDAAASARIRREFRVSGIPRLIVFSENGKILSGNARWDVAMLGAKAVDRWTEDDYVPLTYQDYKNKGSLDSNRNDNRKDDSNRKNDRRREKTASAGTVSVDSPEWVKGPSEQWHIRIDTALAAARKENKKIFVLTTGSNWCSWCRKLYNDVLSSKTFLDYAAENLILVYLDYPRGTKQPEAQRLYNELIVAPLGIYKGAPAAFILNRDGRMIGRISGYRPLERYMSDIQKTIVASPGKKAVPEWLYFPPERLKEQLAELKTTKQNNADKAKAASEKAVEQMKFQVVAWGWSKNSVNTPFYPTETIKVPLKKNVYFKVKYQLPPNVGSAIWLRSDNSNIGSFAHRGRGQGEFVALLAAIKSAKEDKLKIIIRLSMPESKEMTAAELPCNIVWGNEE